MGLRIGLGVRIRTENLVGVLGLGLTLGSRVSIRTNTWIEG